MSHRVSHADANGVESSVKKLATLFLAFAAWELALLNGMDQGALLREGQLVKYITRDVPMGGLRP
ncbi:MAG TPA: hypothetical protein VN203_28625 [Candidatus Acidoferrum sp.]|nr:hypothetical protein [Candidatus Methylomirabilis sp.]HWU41640.1 hypothetical protein [Candidatus Acidoferrum sp.]